jgi:hypothetical protein
MNRFKKSNHGRRPSITVASGSTAGRVFIARTVIAVLFILCAVSVHRVGQSDRPNIVWISLEDIGPMMGCYGDSYARTPVFDGLAAEGIRYNKAHSIAPVCSTSRSSIITGMYPSSLGTHRHRSNVGRPPAFVKMLPNLTGEAGYYTTNNAKKDSGSPALHSVGRLFGEKKEQTTSVRHTRNDICMVAMVHSLVPPDPNNWCLQLTGLDSVCKTGHALEYSSVSTIE